MMRYFSLILAVILGVSLTTPVFSAEFGRLGIRPAYPQEGNARSEAIFIHELEPGAIQEDGVLVVNNTNEEKRVIVYSTDHAIASGGTFTCEQFLEERDEVGSWITVEGEEYVIGAESSQVVPFTIVVPLTAGVGEHNGCIVMQEKKDESERHAGVNLSLRTALRISITIPGDIYKSLEIVDFSSERKPSNGSVYLKPVVRNSGNASIDTDIDVIVSNIFGKQVANFGGEFPVLRDQSSEYQFEMNRTFWGGIYFSRFNASYDRNPDNGLGVQSNIDLVELQSKRIHFFLMPSITALAIYFAILALIILAMLLLFLKYKRHRWIKKTWVLYEVVEGDEIKSIAKDHGISWKLLAKANKIRAPYSLIEVKTLRVPPTKK